MRAGCLAPLACNAFVHNDSIKLLARVFSADGMRKIEVKHSVSHTLDSNKLLDKKELYLVAEQLGREAASLLAEQGATELIHQARP